MLEKLDTINWSALHHFYGEASNIPALLRAILSQDEGERNDANDLLFQAICHQVTICEASAYVVPFLWEMVQSPETPDKASVVFLLASLAKGSSYVKPYYGGRRINEDLQKFLAEDGLDLEMELAKQVKWENETKEAVGQELHLLYPYLKQNDSDMKWCIAQALAYYPEHAQETVPLLEEALTSESDEHTAKEIQKAIAKLNASLSSR